MSITEKSTKKPRISAAAKRQNEEARNRAESSEYLTTKKHIVAREKDNYVKLAFVKDKNGWYKGFGKWTYRTDICTFARISYA